MRTISRRFIEASLLVGVVAASGCGGGSGPMAADPNDALVGSFNVALAPHDGGSPSIARLDIRREGDQLSAWMFAGPPPEAPRFYRQRLSITPELIDVTFNVTDLDSNALHVTRDASGRLVHASGQRVIVHAGHTSRDDYTGAVEVDRVAPTASASPVMAWETATVSFSEPLLTEDLARMSEPGLVRELPGATMFEYQDALRVHLADWRQRSPQGIMFAAHDPGGNALPFDARTAFHDAGEARPLFDLGRDEPTVNDSSVQRSSAGPCTGEPCITARRATIGLHVQGGHAKVGFRFRAAGGGAAGDTLRVPLRVVASPFGGASVESSILVVTLQSAADAATAAEGLKTVSGWVEVELPVPAESSDIGITLSFEGGGGNGADPAGVPARLFLSRVFTKD